MATHGKLKDVSAEELYELYKNEYPTMRELAERYGCTRAAICDKFKAAGINVEPRPHKGRGEPRLTDREQLLELLAVSLDYNDASRRVGFSAPVIRSWCGFHEIVHKYPFRKGNTSPAWKGGIWIDNYGRYRLNCNASGYYEFNPKWTQPSIRRATYVFETQVLGFAKPKGYVTHHIDENKTNDVAENLALLTVSQHVTFHHRLDEARRLAEYINLVEVVERINARVRIASQRNIQKLKAVKGQSKPR